MNCLLHWTQSDTEQQSCENSVWLNKALNLSSLILSPIGWTNNNSLSSYFFWGKAIIKKTAAQEIGCNRNLVGFLGILKPNNAALTEARVKTLISPLLKKLKKSGLNDEQTAYLEALEENLNTVVLPFPEQLSARYPSLTPAKMQVAALIKQGKTTTEIAGKLHLSTKTIDVHRNSLRKKLGITNQKVNLQTFLSSIWDPKNLSCRNSGWMERKGMIRPLLRTCRRADLCHRPGERLAPAHRKRKTLQRH